jgi:hypothetical protein
MSFASRARRPSGGNSCISKVASRERL